MCRCREKSKNRFLLANKQVSSRDNSETRQRRDFGFFVKGPVQFKEELISFWGMISHATDSKKAQMYFSIQKKINYLIIEISKVATIFIILVLSIRC